MEYLFRESNLAWTNDAAGNEHAKNVRAPELPAATPRFFFSFLLWFFAGLWPMVAGASQGATNVDRLSLVELQNTLGKTGRAVRSFRVEGVVCAAAPQRNLVVLEDASGVVMLELPAISHSVRAGDGLTVEGNKCPLTQTRYGIQAGIAPVVDNDGRHSGLEKFGWVFLDAGLNPIRVTWFNGLVAFELKLEYEGPEIPRQQVPASALWHRSGGETNQGDLKPGVLYAAYEGISWGVLPDFARLNPVVEGVATNFSVSYRTRDENCGLTFTGLVQIDHPGLYTFYLTSDDGSRLYVGKPSNSCQTITTPGKPIPAPESLAQALANRERGHWIKTEGEVAFVSENERSLEMEMAIGSDLVPVTVIDGEALFSTNLLHRWLQVEGICEFSSNREAKGLAGIFVPGPGQVKICGSGDGARENSSNDLLTTGAQVRRLKANEAAKHLPAKIQGVVIYSSLTANCRHQPKSAAQHQRPGRSRQRCLASEAVPARRHCHRSLGKPRRLERTGTAYQATVAKFAPLWTYWRRRTKTSTLSAGRSQAAALGSHRRLRWQTKYQSSRAIQYGLSPGSMA
jgi:hypothetical protein